MIVGVWAFRLWGASVQSLVFRRWVAGTNIVLFGRCGYGFGFSGSFGVYGWGLRFVTFLDPDFACMVESEQALRSVFGKARLVEEFFFG